MSAPSALVRRLDARAPEFERELAPIIAFESSQDERVDATVAQIIADVRTRGDAALIELTARFDGVHAASMAELEVTAAEMQRAFDDARGARARRAAHGGGAHSRVPRATGARILVVPRRGR